MIRSGVRRSSGVPRNSGARRSSPERTFESLYKHHAEAVYRYALAMLDRQADAEDATQTTFMNAYRALERGERPRDSGKWLQAIALNVCREHHRRAGRRPSEVSLEDDPGELVLEPATPEIGDVIRGLSCLPFNQRAALVMREFEGRSLAEIAEQLAVTTSAVEALLFRARRALREQLEATLTCSEAEYAISRQLDGALPRSERGALRAHLRQCSECAAYARRVRAQRSAIRSLALVPLPASLELSKLAGVGGGAAAAPASGGSLLAALGASATAKLAALTVAGAAAAGVGYVSLEHHPPAHRPAVTGSSSPARSPRTQPERTAATPPAPSAEQREPSPTSPQPVDSHAAAPRSTGQAVAATGARPRTLTTGSSATTTSPAMSSLTPHGNAGGSASQGASSSAGVHAQQPTPQGVAHAYGRTKTAPVRPPQAVATQNGRGERAAR